MCTFLNTLPKRSKTAGTAKKRNYVLSMRHCPDTETEKAWYRFRILNFGSQNGGDRDYPFITRFVHQMWKKNDKGFSEIESEIVCPVTKWMPWEGDRYDCPICRYANQQWKSLQESNYKNADARQKNRAFGRKYQAIIPIYVVSDPNYEGNNGKFKVLVFSDKKFYEEEFLAKINKQLVKNNCFNGVNAADMCMHMSLVSEKINEGQPNEREWNKKVIDQIAFSKPYDLPAITKEAVDQNLPFDDTYYNASTKAEIDAFYKKYIKVSNDDIIEAEEDVINVYEAPKAVERATTDVSFENTLPVAQTKTITADDLDDIAVDEVAPSKPATSTPASTALTANVIDAEELLAGVEI